MASEENREQPTAANQDTTLSLSNTERITLLQNTIARLGKIVEELYANPGMDLPLDDSINTLVSTTEQLTKAIARPVEPVTQTSESPAEDTPIATTISPPTPPKTVTEASKTKTVAEKNATSVGQGKSKNKPVLIAAIAVTAIALVTALVFWLPPKSIPGLSPQPTSQIEVSLPETKETNEIIVSNEEVTPESNSDNLIAETPSETIDIRVIEPEATDLKSEKLEPETIVEIDVPSELTAPGKGKNLKVTTIKPQIKLTPEQSLIASIQTKVSEIIQDYVPEDDLITNVEANFVDNNLAVQVNDLWYQLDNSRQGEIANEFLKRSRQLNFYKLAIKDPDNNLVARSPVVGDEAIILEKLD